MGVSFKDTLENQEVVARNKRYKALNDGLDNRQQRESDRLAIQMEREINAMKSSGCEVGCRRPQIPIYGKEKRYITPRECARLQSFPDNFIIHENDQTAYKQFGNAVNVDSHKDVEVYW